MTALAWLYGLISAGLAIGGAVFAAAGIHNGQPFPALIGVLCVIGGLSGVGVATCARREGGP